MNDNPVVVIGGYTPLDRSTLFDRSFGPGGVIPIVSSPNTMYPETSLHESMWNPSVPMPGIPRYVKASKKKRKAQRKARLLNR